MNEKKKDEPKVIKSDEFWSLVAERAKTQNANGVVTSSVDVDALFLTMAWEDPRGVMWETEKAAPPSGGKNRIVFMIEDDEKKQTRIYCVPAPEHPGAFTRYIVPRVLHEGAKEEKFVMHKTGNYDLFVACIAYEIRELNDRTPPLYAKDEVFGEDA